ncbi:MAG TPA: prepilin-type N-terminal cleavage/methylation domain-containing protein [Smithellaceae bacterium]
MLRNEKGFTLIEIIAVLVILGILAAVAVPRYLDLMGQARQLAAQGAIAEVKGRLSSAQAKYMMANSGNAPTAAQLLVYAQDATNGYGANLVNVGTDFTIAPLVSASPIVITVNAVQGTTLSPVVNGNFLTANGT